MIIEQNIWGVTPEGEAIIIYTMKNTLGSEVQLTNIGAAIVSVKYADRNGKIDDVVLGYKDPMSYFGDGAASGKTVGRVANRIAGGNPRRHHHSQFVFQRQSFPYHQLFCLRGQRLQNRQVSAQLRGASRARSGNRSFKR